MSVLIRRRFDHRLPYRPWVMRLAVIIFALFAGLLLARQITMWMARASIQPIAESRYFVFCARPEEAALFTPAFLDRHDHYYEQITSDLGHTPSGKIIVRFYPNIWSLHLSYGNPLPWPDDAIGTQTTREIMEVSPNCTSLCGALNSSPSCSSDSLFRHELAHLIHNQILPAHAWGWIEESVAVYEQFYSQARPWARSAIHGQVRSGNLPTLDELSGRLHEGFIAGHGYEYAYTIADYVYNELGPDAYRRFARNPGDLESSLGMSETEFITRWHEYLKAVY